MARFLDGLGSRWTLLIVRDLLVGPRRFTDLASSAPSMGPNRLSQRLHDLQAQGIVEKCARPDGAEAYALTEKGRGLEPVVLEMARWSLRHLPPAEDPRVTARADLVVVALRALFDPTRAAGVDETYELHVDDVVLHARVRDAALTTALGPADRPGCVVTTTAAVADRIGTGTLALEDAERSGLLTLEGSRRAFGRFVRVFGGQWSPAATRTSPRRSARR